MSDATNSPKPAAETQRVDKWLWCARFFKTRTLASRFCQSATLRINDDRKPKAHALVRAGDVLTFPLGHNVRVIEVVCVATRRGPAAEARALYRDLAPPEAKPKTPHPFKPAPPGLREPGSGRPTKRDRRAMDALTKSTDTE